MKKSRKVSLFTISNENLNFCCFEITANAFIEHEKPITPLQSILGITPSEDVLEMKSSRVPEHLFFERRGDITLLAIGCPNLPVEEIFAQKHPDLSLQTEHIDAIWDSNSVAIVTDHKEVGLFLSDLRVAIEHRDSMLFRAPQKDLFFGPLLFGIASRMAPQP